MQFNIKLKSTMKLKKRETLSQLEKRGFRTLFIVILVSIIVLGSAYMYVAGKESHKGYLLRYEQAVKEDLEKKNKEIEKEVVKLKCLEEIGDRNEVKNMESEYDIDYLKNDSTISARIGG